jgi:tetratricopeptide (TPR) repeat protein
LLTVFSSAALLPSEARGGKTASQAKDDPGCHSCISQAASQFAAGHVTEAAALLKSWQERCPNNAQLHLMLSTVLLRQGGHMDEALSAAQQAVNAAPALVAARLQLGLLLSGAENNTRAVQELERTVELAPGSYEAWSTLASVYSKLHEDSKAQEATNKAAELEPSTKTVRLRLLKNLQHSGKLTEAKAELKRLINNGGYGAEFLQQLSEEAMAIGDWDDALSAGNKVVEAYPKAIAPLKLVSIAQYNNHSYQDCLETTKKMLALDPRQPEALAIKGRALVKLGSADQAEKEFKLALANQPELPLALLGQGELEFSRGNFAAASEQLMHSIDADPTLGQAPEVCFELAKALDQKGDRDNAIDFYKRSIDKGISGQAATDAQSALTRLREAATKP